MTNDKHNEDIRAIQALISRQFGSLCWSDKASGDWQAFVADFHSEASLFPAARPASKQTPEAFVERMQGLAATSLPSLHEKVLGTEITVFGNVAVAVAGCEMTENNTETHRGVEMMLLVKSEGAWQIVSQAWDMESEGNLLPSHLATFNK